MFEKMKKDWRILRENPPGDRFQARYRHGREGSGPGAVNTIIRYILGILLILIGVILWFIPGPGWLFVFIGLAFIAGRSRWLSKWMDRAELWVRQVLGSSNG